MPPQDWELADPAVLSEQVEAGFLKKKATSFSPSINLAKEETTVSFDEYISAVRKRHLQAPSTKWKNVGTIDTMSGKGHLMQIDIAAKWGDVRLLQMVHLADGIAYILTAAALQEDYAEYLPIFQKIFRSFALIPDLFFPIKDPTKQEELRNCADSLRLALASTSFSDANFQKQNGNRSKKKLSKRERASACIGSG